MTAASGLAAENPARPTSDWAAQLKDAALAALVAALVTLPLMGLQTYDIGGGALGIRTHFNWVAIAVAGLMVTLYYGVVDFFIGFLAGVKAFTAAVLGGIGSLPGAMLGGILIGLIEAFWSGYFTVEYKDVSVFAVLILVLVFRPTGLLGRPELEKV